MSMTELSPSEVEQVFSNALRMHQTGNLEQAERLYSQVVAADPRHFDGLNLLGVIALQTGRNDVAIEHFKRAMAISDKVADLHNNIAEAHRRLGHADLALAHFGKAASLDPSFTDARRNFARMLAANERPDEALAELRKMLAAEPDSSQTRIFLAEVLLGQGKIEEAWQLYQEVASRDTSSVQALQGLAQILLNRGNADDALPLVLRALSASPTPEIKTLFVQAFSAARNVPAHPDIRRLVATALTEPWARPANLADAATRLVMANTVITNAVARLADPKTKEITAEALFGPFGLSVLMRDELLRALLESVPICDPDLERLLTVMRFLTLQSAGEPKPLDQDTVTFACAIARQCFLNDYVFARTSLEEDLVARARGALENAIKENIQVYPLVPVAIAAYRPLHTITGAEELLRAPAPPPMAALFDQQIRQPLEEAKIRKSLPKLTDIDDEVSTRVQQQYESNPYPTWVKHGPVDNTKKIFAGILGRFLDSGTERDQLQVLIAGCGTGQHSIEAAQSYPGGTKLLAIDLSNASLAYAARKSREAGVANIEYAQADILKLGSLGRTFDIVESSGVLHHLGNPLDGWRVLLSLLRPGGLMRLGFYSKRARRHVNTMRDLIAKGGYQPTPDGIRRTRQTIVDRTKSDEAAAWIARSPDFYSVSACRDLLFHEQEYQFTLPEIAEFLSANGLQFLFFDVMPPHVLETYRQKFPQDQAATDLACWDAFEAEHPHLFGGMYQFWIKKPR